MPLNVVTFYTERYVDFIEAWRRSVRTHGHIPIDEKVKASSWRRAVAMKPLFILKMLGQTGGPVIWLDVDGTMQSQPVLLENAHRRYDVAGWVWNEPPKFPEHMLTGTLWFNDSPLARKVLEGWAKRESTATERGSGQPNLWKTIIRVKPRLLRLPHAYTKIRGMKWRDDVRPTVFEHVCASLMVRYGDRTTVPHLARGNKSKPKPAIVRRMERLQERRRQLREAAK